jgi:hypothetical protein
VHNFDVTPEVTSRDPLWNDGVALPAGEEKFHMPNPSYWPLVVAGGILVAAAGALADPLSGRGTRRMTTEKGN